MAEVSLILKKKKIKEEKKEDFAALRQTHPTSSSE